LCGVYGDIRWRRIRSSDDGFKGDQSVSEPGTDKGLSGRPGSWRFSLAEGSLSDPIERVRQPEAEEKEIEIFAFPMENMIGLLGITLIGEPTNLPAAIWLENREPLNRTSDLPSGLSPRNGL
jgi:hypothetical protein